MRSYPVTDGGTGALNGGGERGTEVVAVAEGLDRCSVGTTAGGRIGLGVAEAERGVGEEGFGGGLGEGAEVAGELVEAGGLGSLHSSGCRG